jgi:uncharacterized protein
MNKVPTISEIHALHEKYAPTAEAFELVFTHCRAVQQVAAQLLGRGNLPRIDAELVRAGCLLHDIGVYRLYDASGRLNHRDYIRHGVLGYELLKTAGFGDAICRFCSCHTGVGLTREDIRKQNLPLPVADYLPASVEERLVLYADKFHTKTDPPKFVTAATYSRDVRRFGDEKVLNFKLLIDEFGEPDLAPLARKYRAAMV